MFANDSFGAPPPCPSMRLQEDKKEPTHLEEMLQSPQANYPQEISAVFPTLYFNIFWKGGYSSGEVIDGGSRANSVPGED